MYNKAPKNKNITVRVTEKQHDEFTRIAHANGSSVSELANHILNEHKDNYRKRERLETLIHQADMASLKKELIDQLLKKFHIENRISNRNKQFLETERLKLAIKILGMTKFESHYMRDFLTRQYYSLVRRLST
jgi:arginine deiminase